MSCAGHGGRLMASQLVCRPEGDLPVAVLRVSGALDTLTGDALRRAVARSLSLQPETLLIDVSRLEIRDPAGVAALSAVACQTAQWPAVPIVLCGAGAKTVPALAAPRDCARLGYADDCDKAREAVAAEPEPRRIRVRLRPVPDACRQVRHPGNQAR